MAISADFFITYKIITEPYASFLFRYDINQLTFRIVELVYDLSPVISLDTQISFDLEGDKALQDFQIEYGLIVSNDFSIEYDMIPVDGMIVQDFEMLYDLEYYPYSETEFIFDILDHNKVHKDFSISYHIYDGGQESLVYSYLRD